MKKESLEQAKNISIEKYSFKKYDSQYPSLFRSEKRKLLKIIGKRPIIDHIGSTSVPGLGGKGIIDILIQVEKKDIPLIMKRLQSSAYEFKPSGGEKGKRWFFQKIYKSGKKERRVHLHLTFAGSKSARASIAVPKYLRENKKLAEKYSQIKKKASEYAKGEGKKYREYKKDFLDKLEKEALKT